MSKPPELTQTKQWGRESSNPERLTEDGHLSREQKEERLARENPGGPFQAEENTSKGPLAGTNGGGKMS